MNSPYDHLMSTSYDESPHNSSTDIEGIYYLAVWQLERQNYEQACITRIHIEIDDPNISYYKYTF
jgi:hypothetical protein